ncbi:hypothetical protein [Rhodococcus daqingensis]|uniref:DUF4231 domain-containing protein n=1 Tax=Rhodococcus daqingensis TaxID=2479363 RepID=A0ABW2RUU9_9NOCA
MSASSPPPRRRPHSVAGASRKRGEAKVSAEQRTREDALRADLGTEYQALVRIVSDFDGRFLIVKSWSVTLSLAAIGLGFQQEHYALFALASGTALAFWFIEGEMKRHQRRYYSRMRDIEVAAYYLNHVPIDDRQESSPRIDWYWDYKGRGPDFRTAKPKRRDQKNVDRTLKGARWTTDVLLPHAVAVVLGLALFIIAVLELPWLEHLKP